MYVTISCTVSALQNILLHSIVLSHYSYLRYTTQFIYATVSFSPATKLLYIPFFSPITPAYDRPQKLFMLYIPPFFSVSLLPLTKQYLFSNIVKQ
jgi:hypothetical protein